MYDIYRRGDGQKVASFWTDPYDYKAGQEANDTIRQVLQEMNSLQQMNRTRFEGSPAYEESGGPERGGTSMEGYQDPSPDHILQTIAGRVSPGYIVMERSDDGGEGGD